MTGLWVAAYKLKIGPKLIERTKFWKNAKPLNQGGNKNGTIKRTFFRYQWSKYPG